MELTVRTKPMPTRWIHFHTAATTASLAAGAIAYTLTNASGAAATTALSSSVSLGGTIAAQAANYFLGSVAGAGVAAGTAVIATTIDQSGRAATNIGSLVASSLVAASVSAAFLLGSTVVDLYQKARGATVDEEVPIRGSVRIEELPEDGYMICDMVVSPTTSTPTSRDEESTDAGQTNLAVDKAETTSDPLLPAGVPNIGPVLA